MAKLKDKQGTDHIKRIFMQAGRLTIDSAYHEWISPIRRVKHDGIVLELKGQERQNPEGFVELDLRVEKDKRIYDRFVEWIADGTDPRISEFNVYELTEGQASAPFTWWATTKADKLVEDVQRTIEHMDTLEERESFVEKCVLFEEQRDTPRKSLIAKLKDMELDVVVNDPMDLPEVSA